MSFSIILIGNKVNFQIKNYENKKIKRLSHVAYVPLILGDKMAGEPRLSALSHSGQNPAILPLLKDKFSTKEWKIYQRLLENDPPLKTSSMGRLFDAVACLLGIMLLASCQNRNEVGPELSEGLVESINPADLPTLVQTAVATDFF